MYPVGCVLAHLIIGIHIPIALRKAKIVYNFGLSVCSRVKGVRVFKLGSMPKKCKHQTQNSAKASVCSINLNHSKKESFRLVCDISS